MAGNQEPEPEWLQGWLNIPFYRANGKCGIHTNKYPTIYCGVCMREPVCEICWREHYKPLHEGEHHQILKVYSASGRAAIEICDIQNLLDTSGIQKYTINGKDIFHLRSKSDKESCGTCTKIQPSFCSIACKFGDEFRDHAPDMGPQIINSPQRMIEPLFPADPPPQSSEPRPNVDEKINKIEIRSRKRGHEEDAVPESISMRKRRRKQLIPQRAPLASYGAFECY